MFRLVPAGPAAVLLGLRQGSPRRRGRGRRGGPRGGPRVRARARVLDGDLSGIGEHRTARRRLVARVLSDAPRGELRPRHRTETTSIACISI